MFLKNKNIVFKIRISKVTDYAALKLINHAMPYIEILLIPPNLERLLKGVVLKMNFQSSVTNCHLHTGKCIRRFGGIDAYCRYFIDRKWLILVLILYRKTCQMA